MVRRILLIALVAMLALSGVAQGSGDDELVQKRALIILGDFQQWVSLRYLYSGNKSTGFAGSSSHEFLEDYNSSFGFDILNPHFFNANLNFSLGLDQNRYDSQGSNWGDSVRYNYQFTGAGLDRSVTPFTISTYQNTDRVQAPFSPSYTATTSGTDLQVDLRNVFLPSTFRFSRIGTETTGGGNDTNAVTNTFSYTVRHQYQDWVHSGLALSISEGTASSFGGGSLDTRAYSLSANNAVQWGARSQYSLASTVQVSEALDQGVTQRNFSWNEGFRDALGKSLEFHAVYSLADSTVSGIVLGNSVGSGGATDPNAAATTNRTRSNIGEVGLTHRLFESLTTRLTGKGTYNQLLDGTESRYSGQADLNYTKKLPDNNRLAINFTELYEVIDNQLGSPFELIPDELHAQVAQGQVITLGDTRPLVDVISVRNRIVDSTGNSISTITYQSPRDYTFDTRTGQITITVGGTIATTANQDILISYRVQVDERLKYSNESTTVSANMTFLGGSHSVGGSYSSQRLSLISGPPNNSLRNSRNILVYLNGEIQPLTYRVAASQNQLGDLTSRTFEGSGQYFKEEGNARYTVVGSDRYVSYDATSTTRSYGENTASCSVGGMRQLNPYARFTVAANAYDTRSDIRSPKDIVSLRGTLLIVVNRMSLTVDGQTSWSFSGGIVTRENTASVQLLRYF
ncbi:hypothetical protein [Geomesophilobacter sediminis]|uniref:TIGR03016 family PEP-CTERM system-associated outer membrane protein n=1 Tax=Geomesophilobacter sediminis TaxID=2798584 RepID=A0A8J7M215_9BACT|nr:hypothetical protein [Geomesophilobacter sediminis]MBJ6727268.1 hypothetical protein [Geomesophilobacter sediminis]